MCIKQTHLIRPCVVIRINFLLTQQYINAWLPLLLSLFPFAAESESTAEPGAIQDILTCGSCQKTFALGDIVKFIQHKVLQCNKENYGQCFPQGKYHTSFSFTSIILNDGEPEQLIAVESILIIIILIFLLQKVVPPVTEIPKMADRWVWWIDGRPFRRRFPHENHPVHRHASTHHL